MAGQDRITVSIEDLEEIIASFGALPEQIERAEARAVNKTVDWLARGAKRELDASIGVAQLVLDDRVRALKHGYNGIPAGMVWFGLNPIAITRRRFGTLIDDRGIGGGVMAAGKYFPGAFVARMRSGHVGAFRRRGKSRFPIDHESLVIDTPAHRAILDAWADRASERLKTVLAQELNYEVNVKGL